jgi:hypothetical protein
MEGSSSRLSQRSIHRRPACRDTGKAATARSGFVRSRRAVTRFSWCGEECLDPPPYRSGKTRPASGEVLQADSGFAQDNPDGIHGNRRRFGNERCNHPAACWARGSVRWSKQLQKSATDPRADRKTVPTIVPAVENPCLNRSRTRRPRDRSTPISGFRLRLSGVPSCRALHEDRIGSSTCPPRN